MPEKIAGLDFGERHVKAVSVSAGLKGYQIVDSAVIDIAEAGGVEAALERIFQREGFHGSALAISIPLRQCSFRTVLLPFTDRKKIRQTLPYELEQLLPFPVDNALVDYSRAVELDPDSEAHLAGLAVIQHVLDNHDDARQQWQALVEADARFKTTTLLRDEYLWSQKMIDAAQAIIDTM